MPGRTAAFDPNPLSLQVPQGHVAVKFEIAQSLTSGFAPLPGLDVELHSSCCSHAHQQFLQGFRALVAGIEPLLQ
jgi:hypothetical protein